MKRKFDDHQKLYLIKQRLVELSLLIPTSWDSPDVRLFDTGRKSVIDALLSYYDFMDTYEFDV